MASITNSSIRINNRKKIVNLLFMEGEMTKLELSQRLDISVPTVTTILNGLMDIGLVQIAQILGSTGGRKAASFAPVLEARYSLGADASEEGLHLVLLDLGGNIIAKEFYPVMRDNSVAYWEKVDRILIDFVSANLKDTGSLLDTGITLEIPMEDGKALRGRNGELVDLDLAQSCLSHRITFRNSTKMAALAQIWNQGDEDNFLYLKLGNTLNSTAVYQGQVLDFSAVNGAVGSLVTDVSSGETLTERMSAENLIKKAGVTGREEFFALVDAKDPSALKIWDQYLEDLAVLLYNLNCIYSWRIIIGGALSPRIEASSRILKEKINRHADKYPGNKARFVFSELGEYASAVGAAMLPIDHFLEDLG